MGVLCGPLSAVNGQKQLQSVASLADATVTAAVTTTALSDVKLDADV